MARTSCQIMAMAAAMAALAAAGPSGADERAGEAVRVQPASVQQATATSGTIATGDTIFRLARVSTRETGSVEMALDDGSALTLGPNSDVVIDDFVYDAGTGDGRASISFAVGALRMVSGRVPSDQVTVQTPVAQIGIRGTDFTVLTRAAGVIGMWVDDGAIFAVPNLTGIVFEFSAPAYAECTASLCRIAEPPARPVAFPQDPGSGGTQPGSWDPFGAGDRGGGEGGSGGGGSGRD